MSQAVEHIASGYILKCDQVLNEGRAYNGHTGVLTVPVTGIYQQLPHWKFDIRLVVNNRNLVDAVAWPNHATHDVMAENTAIVFLTTGESVWLEVYLTTDGEVRSYSNYRFTTFSGVLLF